MTSMVIFLIFARLVHKKRVHNSASHNFQDHMWWRCFLDSLFTSKQIQRGFCWEKMLLLLLLFPFRACPKESFRTKEQVVFWLWQDVMCRYVSAVRDANMNLTKETNLSSGITDDGSMVEQPQHVSYKKIAPHP